MQIDNTIRFVFLDGRRTAVLSRTEDDNFALESGAFKHEVSYEKKPLDFMRLWVECHLFGRWELIQFLPTVQHFKLRNEDGLTESQASDILDMASLLLTVETAKKSQDDTVFQLYYPDGKPVFLMPDGQTSTLCSNFIHGFCRYHYIDKSGDVIYQMVKPDNMLSDGDKHQLNMFMGVIRSHINSSMRIDEFLSGKLSNPYKTMLKCLDQLEERYKV